MKLHWRRAFSVRVVINSGLAVIAAGAAVVGCGYYLSERRHDALTASPSAQRVRKDAGTELAAALGVAGLDAPALAAAGVSAETVPEVVEAARDYLGEHPFTAVAEARAGTHAEVERLQRLIQQGKATANDVEALAPARADAASAESAFQSAVSAIFTAATAGLSQGQTTALQRIKANRGREVALKYLATERGEAQWVQLRGAAAAVRIATRKGREPPGASQTIVSEADTAASAAAAGLANLAQVRSAWAQAAEGE